jgi:hypothetical protein
MPARQRVRLPRYFGPDKALRLYSAQEAAGQLLLWSAEGGRYVVGQLCAMMLCIMQCFLSVSMSLSLSVCVCLIEHGVCVRRFANEWYHFHQELSNGKLIVSNKHIIMVERERWFAPVQLVRGLQLTSRHLLILFAKPVSTVSIMDAATDIKVLKPLQLHDWEQLRLVNQQLIETLRVLRQER